MTPTKEMSEGNNVAQVAQKRAMCNLGDLRSRILDPGSFRSLANADLLLQIHLRWQPISCYLKDFEQLLLLATQQTLAHRTTCM